MKKYNNKRNKIHLHLNIEQGLYEYLKKKKFNASRFVEDAIIRLRKGLKEENTAVNNMGMVLICPAEADINIPSVKPIEDDKSTEKHQTSSGIVPKSKVAPKPSTNVTIDTVKDGDNLPWDGGYSMAVFLKSWESRYIRYKKNMGVTDDTIKNNLTSINSLTWLTTIEDIKNREYIKKSDKDALYEVCAFLRDELFESGDTFNGFSNSQYRKVIADRYKPNRGKNSDSKTRELINFPEIVTQTMELLPADVQVFFILTAVCGARTAQLYRVFEKPLRILKHEKFFRIIATDAGHGTKLATEYFFPMDYLPMVENFTLFTENGRQDKSSFYNDTVNNVSRVVNESIPCNLSSLRKFCKAVFSKSKIPAASAEYTQGRKPEGIGPKDYDNVPVNAVDDYPDTLPFWEKYIKLPDWIKDGEIVKQRVDEAIAKRVKSKSRNKKWDENTIVKRLKAGSTNAELRKEFGIGGESIMAIVKKHKIVRTNDRGASKKKKVTG